MLGFSNKLLTLLSGNVTLKNVVLNLGKTTSVMDDEEEAFPLSFK